MIKNIAIVIVGGIALFLVLTFVVPELQKPSVGGILQPGGMVACTMEAKICPDGSAVGRVGPNCEFAPCPGEPGSSYRAPQVVFNCAEGKSITATFYESSVEFYVSDGRSRTFNLTRTSSSEDTEVRFEGDNGQTVLWVKDYSAFLEEGGETTFANCVVSSADVPSVSSAREPAVVP